VALLELVGAELRQVAAGYLSRERAGPTLQRSTGSTEPGTKLFDCIQLVPASGAVMLILRSSNQVNLSRLVGLILASKRHD
jgi:hypothetical protein